MKFRNKYLLAPMLEPNDIAFRLLCKRCGAGLTTTGMASPLSKKELILDDKPGLQIFGNNPKGIVEFVKKYDGRVSMWDFNLGCPSKLSKKLSIGSFMHKDFENIEKILSVIRKNTKKIVSIKLRKSLQAIQVAKLAEKYVDVISIHPRTSDQGYSGKPDYGFAFKLKKAVKVPVIYSGDVDEKNAREILGDFDYVYVGRAAIGNPKIFSKITGSNVKVTFEDYLELAEKYAISYRQIKYQAMNFTKSEKNAKLLRRKLIGSKTVDEIREVMKTNKN